MGGYGGQVISSLSPDWFQDQLTVIIKCISDQHTLLWERSGYQTGWFFGKVPRGWGSLSIQKFIVQILGTLSRFFWAWNWYIQKSNFRVKGIFFQQLYCITPISGNDVHAFHTIWPSYLLAYMQPYPLWKKCSIIFRIWGGGGWKAVLNFSENSSYLVQPSFPCF